MHIWWQWHNSRWQRTIAVNRCWTRYCFRRYLRPQIIHILRQSLMSWRIICTCLTAPSAAIFAVAIMFLPAVLGGQVFTASGSSPICLLTTITVHLIVLVCEAFSQSFLALGSWLLCTPAVKCPSTPSGFVYRATAEVTLFLVIVRRKAVIMFI